MYTRSLSVLLSKLCSFAFVGLSTSLASAATLTALTSFAGDGWLAPGESGYNPGSGLARGLTYNSVTNKVYVVDRTGGISVKVYDGTTGAAAGTLNVDGIAGGTFALNQIDVDANGVIYAANLSTADTANFKVYRWANESATPTVAFDGLTGRVRTGDTFAVTGSGASTLFVSAGGATPGQNYSLFSTANGTTFSSSNPALTGPVVAGAFRLGIDFGANGSVLGSQTGNTALYSAASNGVVTVTNTAVTGEAPLAFYNAGANSLLAMLDVSTNTVRLYDSTLSAPAVSSLNLTTAFLPNGNGVGDLKFGTGPDGQLRLYALATDNGIQAFAVVPEPGSAVLGLIGLAALARRRRN